MSVRRARVSLILLAAAAFSLAGCGGGQLLGGMLQNYEYGLLIEVHPAYPGLENNTVAVLVDVGLATLYEYPDLALSIAANVSRRLRKEVPGVRVLDSRLAADWQFRTPQWNAIPYGEIAEQLKVDRLVYIDLYEYRLHPPGNQWLWEGVCAANVSIIERDGFDPDTFVETFSIRSKFPDLQGVGRDSATRVAVETGLRSQFVERAAWLFYFHLEPKYPDKYRAQP